jgi:hypothetical protein
MLDIIRPSECLKTATILRYTPKLEVVSHLHSIRCPEHGTSDLSTASASRTCLVPLSRVLPAPPNHVLHRSIVSNGLGNSCSGTHVRFKFALTGICFCEPPMESIQDGFSK